MPLRVVVSIYSICMILLHKKINEVMDLLYNRYSFERVDRFIFYLALVLLVGGFGSFIASQLRGKRNLLIPAAAIMFFPIPFMYILFFVSSIEVIHFIQYAILSLLLMSIFKDFSLSFFVSMLLGILDEIYQYFVLYAGQPDVYLDYNDMVLNNHGAIMGIIIYLLVRNPSL